ncbi:hypothetical protein [Priestia megaterium]|uniref:hypothetical protein n=1 Tax=Priestia megaterium TaxID=1404 RepID=UPI001FB2AD06|nr:hypothetical protein [Priestia megaterium]
MQFEIVNEPRIAIEEQIPSNIRSKFVPIIVDAYQWVYILTNNTDMLKGIRARKKTIPELKNVAVEYFVLQAVKNGSLPYNYRMASNRNNSHTYLELYSENTLIHFNQVRNKSSCANRAYCRDRHIKPAYSYMNFEKNIIEFDEQRYFQINHGYQSTEPSFVTLGVPNEGGKLSAYINLFDEFTSIEGHYPKSKIEEVDDISFEDFQRFAEGEGLDDSEKSS